MAFTFSSNGVTWKDIEQTPSCERSSQLCKWLECCNLNDQSASASIFAAKSLWLASPGVSALPQEGRLRRIGGLSNLRRVEAYRLSDSIYNFIFAGNKIASHCSHFIACSALFKSTNPVRSRYRIGYLFKTDGPHTSPERRGTDCNLHPLVQSTQRGCRFELPFFPSRQCWPVAASLE